MITDQIITEHEYYRQHQQQLMQDWAMRQQMAGMGSLASSPRGLIGCFGGNTCSTTRDFIWQDEPPPLTLAPPKEPEPSGFRRYSNHTFHELLDEFQALLLASK